MLSARSSRAVQPRCSTTAEERTRPRPAAPSTPAHERPQQAGGALARAPSRRSPVLGEAQQRRSAEQPQAREDQPEVGAARPPTRRRALHPPVGHSVACRRRSGRARPRFRRRTRPLERYWPRIESAPRPGSSIRLPDRVRRACRARVPDRSRGGRRGLAGHAPAGRRWLTAPGAMAGRYAFSGRRGLRGRLGAADRRAARRGRSPAVADGHGCRSPRERCRRRLGRGRRQRILGRRRRGGQEGKRVAVCAAAAGVADAEVQVWTIDGPRSRRADGADPLPRLHGLALSHRRRGQVKVGGVEAVESTDAHGDSRGTGGAGEADASARGRHHRLSRFARYVDAPVLAACVGVVPVRVGRDDLAMQRPDPGRPGWWSEQEESEQCGSGGEDEAMHDGDRKADTASCGRRGAELSLSFAEL